MTEAISYNRLQTDGFEFVEYTAAVEKGIQALKDLFCRSGSA
ncbi:MAG: 4-hydroxyphenylpyruvate dioxygenase [Paraglaciecola sp.]|jgi:4-hydroxyphenylpyruvate dioxygenase